MPYVLWRPFGLRDEYKGFSMTKQGFREWMKVDIWARLGAKYLLFIAFCAGLGGALPGACAVGFGKGVDVAMYHSGVLVYLI